MSDNENCACRTWASTDLGYLQSTDGRHHPYCDGSGKHTSRLSMSDIESYSHVEAESVPVSEPELSLLVVDFGSSGCVFSIETNERTDLHNLLSRYQTIGGNLHYTARGFPELRAVIDEHFAESDKSVPRIERGGWAQIYPTGAVKVSVRRVSADEQPPPQVAIVTKPPCAIWRYER